MYALLIRHGKLGNRSAQESSFFTIKQGFTLVTKRRIKREKRERAMTNILVFDALIPQVA